jgi:hypothetical protein
MKFLPTVFVIFSLLLLAICEKPPRHDEIVEENGICLEEIKALELCLKEAGQGKGWCGIGASVTDSTTNSRSTYQSTLLQIQQKQLMFA